MANPNIPPGPGRPKGLKNKATLLKEERRAIFDAEVSKMFLETIKKARPEYLLDQFMGAATQKHEIDTSVKITRLPEKAVEIIEEDLKQKKLND